MKQYIFTSFTLLCYFTFICLVALLLIDYITYCGSSRKVLSLQPITESKCLATYAPY